MTPKDLQQGNAPTDIKTVVQTDAGACGQEAASTNAHGDGLTQCAYRDRPRPRGMAFLYPVAVIAGVLFLIILAAV